MTKVVGYRRLSPTGASKEEREAKLRKQERKIEEHCKDNGKELVQLFTAEGVSGRKETPHTREVFRELLRFLRENDDVEEIVVHHFDRITRQAIPRAAIVEIVQAATWREDVRIYSTKEEEYAKSFASLEEVTAGELFGAIAEGFSSQNEKQKEAEKVTEVLQDKKRENKPIGRQPRGITTDKQHSDYESEEATIRLPGDGFEECIEILNEFATTDKSAYQVGKEFGLKSPDSAVKSMWDRRDKYREAAENDREDWKVRF